MAHYSTTPRLSRNAPGTESLSAAAFSPAAEGMIYVLNNISPQDFYDGIRKAFTPPLPLTQHQIGVLLDIMEAARIPNAAIAKRIAKDDTTRHCVRCHQGYVEKYNGQTACSIPHDTAEAQVGPLGLQWYYHCCSLVTVPELGHNPGLHFLGRHTTQEKGVQYTGSNIQGCRSGCPSYGPPSASPDVMTSPATSRCSTPESTSSDTIMACASFLERESTTELSSDESESE
ncbi:hypothetical protein B0H14DRAFT_940622 [Mycena olivaceomarginata]|nr:hypothetical protein B0H14DRAFT_940622 [Mycena olivaceomarginata]